MPQAELPGTPVSVLTIFLTFSRITLSSFGSPAFWARRELVERQRWFTAQEFVDFLALGQILPGPNILNVTALVGYRFAGWTGAVAAVVGFLGWPFFLVIALGVLHQRYGGLVLVQQALTGMSAVAAGLLLANGVLLATVLPRHWYTWLFGVLAFTGVGVLRWPLPVVIGLLVPLALVAAWKGQD